jgi:hypothetical protein
MRRFAHRPWGCGGPGLRPGRGGQVVGGSVDRGLRPRRAEVDLQLPLAGLEATGEPGARRAPLEVTVEPVELAGGDLTSSAVAEMAGDRQALPAAGRRPGDPSPGAPGLGSEAVESGALRGHPHVSLVGDRTPPVGGKGARLGEGRSDAWTGTIGPEQLREIGVDDGLGAQSPVDRLVFVGSGQPPVVGGAVRVPVHYGPSRCSRSGGTARDSTGAGCAGREVGGAPAAPVRASRRRPPEGS